MSPSCRPEKNFEDETVKKYEEIKKMLPIPISLWRIKKENDKVGTLNYMLSRKCIQNADYAELKSI